MDIKAVADMEMLATEITQASPIIKSRLNKGNNNDWEELTTMLEIMAVKGFMELLSRQQ